MYISPPCLVSLFQYLISLTSKCQTIAMESTHIGVEYLVYQLALQPSLIWKISALTAVVVSFA